MGQASIEEIQQNLPTYLQRVEAGETVVIVRAGQPVAEVKLIVETPKTFWPTPCRS